ncbi:MAG: AMP-binding protein [Bacteriovoracaceae bacterium]|jgi:fatty-acyl-CoA synthase|nr:AMP-binding protein [Bacteriovoracaceae bacterium]
MKDTILDLFIKRAEDGIATVTFFRNLNQKEEHSYSDLLNGAKKVASYLVKTGVKKGETVTLCLPTGAEFYHAYFGALLMGAVPCAIYPPLRLGKLDEWVSRTSYMLKSVNSKIVLTEKRIHPFLGTPVLNARVDFGCITVEAASTKFGSEVPEIVSPTLFPNDVAFIQFSSGSTGKPKAQCVTHRNLICNLDAIISTLSKSVEEMIGVSWLPLYHDMGLVGAFHGAIYSGGNLVLIPPEIFVARPLTWFEAISDMKATITVAPNFSFGLSQEKIKDEEIQDLDLSSLKVVMSGAEPVHPDTMERFFEKFSKANLKREAITPVYGLAEATLAVTFSDMDSTPIWKSFDKELLHTWKKAVLVNSGGVQLASVGKALPGISLEIRNEDSAVLGEGKVGELWIKGDSIARGFNDNGDCETNSNWINTGDLGFLFEDQLYLCGRSKDILIIRGKNLDPAPIEQVVSEFGFIRSGCVALFGVYDDKSGTEKAILAAELKGEDNPMYQQRMKEVVASEFSIDLSQVVLLPPSTLPRTSSGKIRRNQAKNLFEAGHLKYKKEYIPLKVFSNIMKGKIDYVRQKLGLV